MSAAKHTKGPWFTNKFSTGTEEGVEILEKSGGPGFSRLVLEIITRSGTTRRQEMARAEANAARIVACVNACEGIEDPSALLELFAALRKHIEYTSGPGSWFTPYRDEILAAFARAECLK